jgi:hypothetical protein
MDKGAIAELKISSLVACMLAGVGALTTWCGCATALWADANAHEIRPDLDRCSAMLISLVYHISLTGRAHGRSIAPHGARLV